MAVPTWTDAVAILTPTKVAAGAATKCTFDLGGYFGGYLFIRAMRAAATPATGMTILVRRLLVGTPAGGSGTVNINHPAPIATFQDTTLTGHSTTLTGTQTVPGATLGLTSGTGFAAGGVIGVVDSTTTPTKLEFARISKVVTNTLTLDENVTNTAFNGAATGTVVDNAMVLPPVWVDGALNSGDVEVVFDNGAEATIAYIVEVWGQKLTAIG